MAERERVTTRLFNCRWGERPVRRHQCHLRARYAHLEEVCEYKDLPPEDRAEAAQYCLKHAWAVYGAHDVGKMID